MAIIETQRLILRELEESDVDDLAAIYADPEVMRHFTKTNTRDETLDFIRWAQSSYRDHGYGLWATIDKPSGRLIGRCGLILQNFDDDKHVEVGYLLAKAYWGRGLATEAANACRDWAFTNLPIDHLVSMIAPENLASVAVAKKNGMVFEKNIYVAKWERNVDVFMITREAWEAAG